jgi:hypothetical protein
LIIMHDLASSGRQPQPWAAVVRASRASC